MKKIILVIALGALLFSVEAGAVGRSYPVVTSYHVYYWTAVNGQWLPAPQSVFAQWWQAEQYARQHFTYYRIVPIRRYNAWVVNFMSGRH